MTMEQEQIANTAAKLAERRARAPLVLGCTARARLPCWSKVAWFAVVSARIIRLH